MLSTRLNRRLDRRGIHYAWLIAALTFLVMLTTSAALGLPGAFLLPLSREHGWSTEQISSVLAVRFALYGLMAPFSAMLMERFGVRRVVATALALIAGGMALATVVRELWQLFIAWGLMLGIGSGMTALVLAALVANRWFTARRGLVVGILTASAATGQLAFLPLAAWLIEHLGWRSAVVPVLLACSVLAVLVMLLMRSRPRDLGLAAFGEVPASVAAAPEPAPAAVNLRTPFVVLREAMGTQTFWVLAGTFFICGLSTNGLIQTHFIALCADHDMAPTLAADMLAAIGIFDFFGTVGSGWLSDRMSARRLLFWYYALRGLALLGLPFSHFTIFGLSPFVVFYGLDWVATVPPTVKLANEHFGERANVVFGWVFAGHQIGAACAAWGAGLTRTLYESYLPAFVVAGSLCLLAALALALARETPPEVPATFAPEGALR